MTASTWQAPPVWSVPREWPGARAFVLCGGESISAQSHRIPQLPGPIVAVKHAVRYRPDAEVLFFAGEFPDIIAKDCLPHFRGRYIVVRGKGHPAFPDHAKRIGRPEDGKRVEAHYHWSEDPSIVVGFDAGTSAINLAILFGATEVIVLGYDMQGGRSSAAAVGHPLPIPREDQHQAHLRPLPALAEDARRKGIRIINVSPTSRVECFERGRLEDFG